MSNFIPNKTKVLSSPEKSSPPIVNFSIFFHKYLHASDLWEFHL